MLSRRTFLKGALVVAALASAGSVLSACAPAAEEAASSTSSNSSASSAASASESSESSGASAEERASAAATSGSVLVAYFSASGNTRAVAEAIAQYVGADMFEITPVEPYTDADPDYNDDASRTSVERANGATVDLVEVTPPDFAGYDTVFVGYPIWWGDASWVVDGFVVGSDFSGKTVVPFCTSGGSGIGSSGQNLAALAGSGAWVEGERFSAGASTDEIAAWVDGLGL